MAKRKKTSNEDLPEENQGAQSPSDENFGLPEIEYEPLDRSSDDVVEESQATHTHSDQISDSNETTSATNEWESTIEESTSDYTYTPPPPEPIWPKLLGAILILLIIGGAAWYFFSYAPAQKAAADKARMEADALNAAEAKRIADERRAADEKRKREEEDRRRAEELLATAAPAEGTIEVLNARTSRYYVVITSAIDGDLAMDYAKKLSKKGISTKVIPPFGKSKFNRLAIADHSTWAEAQANAESVKSEYGDAVWVIKY
jgi:hypothetical protein